MSNLQTNPRKSLSIGLLLDRIGTHFTKFAFVLLLALLGAPMNASAQPSPCCPKISNFKATVSECENGKRLVTLSVNIFLANCQPPITIQWNFGDGPPIVPQSISTSGTYTQTHAYAAGAYSAVISTDCERVSVNFDVPPCPSIQRCCPKVTNLNAAVGQCDPATGLTPVTFSGNIQLQPPPCPQTVQLIWDFGDGPPTVPQSISAPSTLFSQTHSYSTSGNYVATLTVMIEDSICQIIKREFYVPPCESQGDCCPKISLNHKVDSCDARGNIWVTFTANITLNPNPTCPRPINVIWDFENGATIIPQTISSSGIYTQSHSYTAPGPYTAQLSTVPQPKCPPVVVQVTLPCPTVSLNVDQIVCNPDGTIDVTLTATVTANPASCPVVAQLDYGDGSPVVPVGVGTTTFTHTYSGSAKPYTASLTIITPTGCPGATALINCPPIPPCCCCCTWLCMLLLIIFMVIYAIFSVAFINSLFTNSPAVWTTAITAFVVALVLAIILAICCCCCNPLWMLFYILLLVTIIYLIIALTGNASAWPKFFTVLALAVLVAILIFLFCGSCSALWMLFTLFLLLATIFFAFALCAWAKQWTPPANFWLFFIIVVLLMIVLAIVINKLCGSTICDYLLALASAGFAGSILFMIVQNLMPCANWLNGTTKIPPNPQQGMPYINIPNIWFFTAFFWLIWLLVCHIKW